MSHKDIVAPQEVPPPQWMWQFSVWKTPRCLYAGALPTTQEGDRKWCTMCIVKRGRVTQTVCGESAGIHFYPPQPDWRPQKSTSQGWTQTTTTSCQWGRGTQSLTTSPRKQILQPWSFTDVSQVNESVPTADVNTCFPSNTLVVSTAKWFKRKQKLRLPSSCHVLWTFFLKLCKRRSLITLSPKSFSRKTFLPGWLWAD